tara:strand:- start:24 stop:449 length:426 start_codon:yes stop_codon:yes gene_type:complete
MSKPNPNLAVKAILYWPNLDKVNKMSGKFQVDLTNLSPAAVTALSEQGIKIKTKTEEMGSFITCKSEYVIVPLDEEGKEVTAMIGNGTKATVQLRVKSGKNPQFGAWTIASISKLIITEVVEYEGADDSDDGVVPDYADAL